MITAMSLRIPAALAANCQKSTERKAWLDQLPATIESLQQRWSLRLAPALDTPEVTASFVATAQRKDGVGAILKIGMPHFEALHEIDGLRFWSGDPTVRLLEAAPEHNAMLLERCDTGTSLRELAEPEQDRVIASLLRRLWRKPTQPHPFRSLCALTALWSEETLAQESDWTDEGLVREGLRLFHDLPRNAPTEALLATDLHAGNVLRAQREPWLVIDPKPFVGDPAYDVTQHLFNNLDVLRSNPLDRIHHLADLLDLDPNRIRHWTFARLAAEPRDNWSDPTILRLTHTLVPR
jgi:streptomycin 6-kinase